MITHYHYSLPASPVDHPPATAHREPVPSPSHLPTALWSVRRRLGGTPKKFWCWHVLITSWLQLYGHDLFKDSPGTTAPWSVINRTMMFHSRDRKGTIHARRITHTRLKYFSLRTILLFHSASLVARSCHRRHGTMLQIPLWSVVQAANPIWVVSNPLVQLSFSCAWWSAMLPAPSGINYDYVNYQPTNRTN